MNVIPTLLTTTPKQFIDQMDTFQKYYSRIQLDVGDGDLVSNTTVQIEEIIELTEKKEVMFLPSVVFDFHLMVRDFKKELQNIKKMQSLGLKVKTVLVNAALKPDIQTLAREYSFSIGLDIFPDVSVSEVVTQYNLKLIPSIQIMTVSPGFQGSPFLPDMLSKIEQLRTQDYKYEIMIDGGVNGDTIPIIQGKKYVPDFVCIGSYLTQAENLKERVAELNNI